MVYLSLIVFSWMQAYYLAVPFPIEKALTKKVTTLESGVKISELVNYPVRGLVFEDGNTMQDLSNNVSDACICLQENNIPYNVLIADSGKRVFLLPQVCLLYQLVTFTFCSCTIHLSIALAVELCTIGSTRVLEDLAELIKIKFLLGKFKSRITEIN